jgi:ABC-type sulfate transport system permease component
MEKKKHNCRIEKITEFTLSFTGEKSELQWRKKADRFFFSLYFFILFLLIGNMFSLSTGCKGYQVSSFKKMMMWTNRKWCVQMSVLEGVLLALLNFLLSLVSAWVYDSERYIYI